MHALGLEFGSAAQLSKRPGSVWNCLWGNALKRSPGIIRKSRVSYPGPGFLSSATWPSLPKKHYNGLNQTKPNPVWYSPCMNRTSQVGSLPVYSPSMNRTRQVGSLPVYWHKVEGRVLHLQNDLPRWQYYIIITNASSR